MSDNFVKIPTFKGVNRFDYIVTPFQVFKEWKINNNDYSSSHFCSIYRATYPIATEYKNELIPISSSKYIGTYTQDNKDTKILWSSVNHLYYKDYNKYQFPFSDTKLHLYDSASILSIPQLRYGETIKVGSFEINDYSISSQSLSSSLNDDGKSNLIDVSIDSSSFAPYKNLIGYWGFNDKFKYINTFLIRNDKHIKDFSDNNNNAIVSGSSTKYIPGITTTGLFTSSSGYQISLHGESVVEVENTSDFNNLDEFAISLWTNISSYQPVSESKYNYVISKQRQGISDTFNNQTRKVERREIDINSPYYPYALAYNNQTNKLEFFRSSGVDTLNLTSSSSINDIQRHIVINKTGSLIEMYIDGIRESYNQDVNTSVDNNCKLFFGGLGRLNNRLSGSLDEIRMYNTSLTQTQINALYDNDFITGSAYQTQRVGNIFYEDGLVVISDPRPKYKNILMGKTGSKDYISGSIDYGFNFKYKSTVTLYEHEVVCKIKQGDFNMTLNPSIRKNGTLDSQEPKSFVSSSSWTPYITTIGLYNDRAELVAIGKLGRPIPKRNDVDMNIIVRFDA